MHYDEDQQTLLRNTLAVVLAGGKGSRLEPLTRDRAKPAVPFGGSYRIIDFSLSNCINSGMRKILVLTQYKAISLDRHIDLGWRSLLSHELGEFIDILHPQQRIDDKWYQGTADAVYQNIYTLEKERPRYVLILAGDHIYKMNYGTLVEFHRDRNADLTIGALRVNAEDARHFGVMQIDADGRVIGFEEKMPNARTIPGDPRHCLASMGIYVFNSRFLFEQLMIDATRQGSAHDFGHNIIPSVIDSHRVFAYPFRDENRKQDAYWRDVGTLDAYFEANMDLVHVDPLLNMYDARWPIRTYQPNLPPPKFVFAAEGPTPAAARRSTASSAREALSPAATLNGRSSDQTRESTASRRFMIRSCSLASISGGMPAFAGRSSTRESASRQVPPSASTPRKIARGDSSSARTGSR